MIKTGNPGIIEAIREIKVMGLGKTLRWMYEMRMKEIRDRNARDDYVRDEGIAIGENKKLIYQIRKKIAQNISSQNAATMLGEDTSLVEEIYAYISAHPDWDDEQISRELTPEPPLK